MKLSVSHTRVATITNAPKVTKDPNLTEAGVMLAWMNWAKKHKRESEMKNFIRTYGALGLVPAPEAAFDPYLDEHGKPRPSPHPRVDPDAHLPIAEEIPDDPPKEGYGFAPRPELPKNPFMRKRAIEEQFGGNHLASKKASHRMAFTHGYSRVAGSEMPEVTRNPAATPEELKAIWEAWAKANGREADLADLLTYAAGMKLVPKESGKVAPPVTHNRPLGVTAPVKKNPTMTSIDAVEAMIRTYSSQQTGMPTSGEVGSLPPDVQMMIKQLQPPVHQGPNAMSQAMAMGRGLHFFISPRTKKLSWLLARR
jgi:hypothetical protein